MKKGFGNLCRVKQYDCFGSFAFIGLKVSGFTYTSSFSYLHDYSKTLIILF